MLNSESCVGDGGAHLKMLNTVWHKSWTTVKLTGNDGKTLTGDEAQYEDGVLRFRVRA